MPLEKQLVRNTVYPDGYVLGAGSDGRPIRVRFFDSKITVFDIATGAADSTAVKTVKTLSKGYIIAQTYHVINLPTRSDWAPHPKEWYAAAQMNGTAVERTALDSADIQYFATRADFKEIGWTKDGASGTANDDPRHFYDSESKKEGENPVPGLYFLINDEGKAVRCDKDGKLLKSDGTYINSADDPKKIAGDGGDVPPATFKQKVVDFFKKSWGYFAVGTAATVAYILYRKNNKPSKKGK